MFDGNKITIKQNDSWDEVWFDAKDAPVNKFDEQTITELESALELVTAQYAARPLVLRSTKPTFIVGADITEFPALFAAREEAVGQFIGRVQALFSRLEDHQAPTLALINGAAMGGGLEVALACDYRIAAAQAVVGQPETTLGLIPGFGGCVRLPRIIGLDAALRWIIDAKHYAADVATSVGLIDTLYINDRQIESVVDEAILSNEHLDRRAQKKEIPSDAAAHIHSAVQAWSAPVESTRARYPAQMNALNTVTDAFNLPRDAAMTREADGFVEASQTAQCRALIGRFEKDQAVKRIVKQRAQTTKVRQAGLVGAGVMGGGIAYQCALKGIDIAIVDVSADALDACVQHVERLCDGAIQRGRMDASNKAKVLNALHPSTNYSALGKAEIIIEAVSENETIKKNVIGMIESDVGAHSVIATNTSTIRIDTLAQPLAVSDSDDTNSASRFGGLHFFNPVERMPLVEVVRGAQTSEATLNTLVSFAAQLGKVPIIVGDCAGFFVNRVLFPYLQAFNDLVIEGVEIARIDRVMEEFGWPMGPAVLLDVIGLDVAYHADAVLAAAYPERMAHSGENILDRLFALKRFGRKNGAGYYRYDQDDAGKQVKTIDPRLDALIGDLIGKRVTVSDNDIVERLMGAVCCEVVRALEDGTIASIAEADMALIYGLGFPDFKGGAFAYMNEIGVREFVERMRALSEFGQKFAPTAAMDELAKTGGEYR